MISAVVLLWQSKDVIEACLQSLVPQLEDHDEVLLVDNGSRDMSLSVARAVAGFARVLSHSRNVGVAAGRQSGVTRAHGDYVLFLDDDAVLLPGCLANLKACMARHERVAVVGPRMVDDDGSVVASARPFPTLLEKLGVASPMGNLRKRAFSVREKYVGIAEATRVPYVIGACQLVRRHALMQIGGLDTAFFYGPEDADMCLRMWRVGLETWYEPSALVRHPPRRAGARNPLGRAGRQHARALARYFAKHRYVVSAPPFP